MRGASLEHYQPADKTVTVKMIDCNIYSSNGIKTSSSVCFSASRSVSTGR